MGLTSALAAACRWRDYCAACADGVGRVRDHFRLRLPSRGIGHLASRVETFSHGQDPNPTPPQRAGKKGAARAGRGTREDCTTGVLVSDSSKRGDLPGFFEPRLA